jgi:hypothetical protein
MSAIPDGPSANRYIVSFGSGGALGVFSASAPTPLRRGDRVVVRSPRGTDIGTVLCPATDRQARLLGATPSGSLLRPVGAEDGARLEETRRRADAVFEASRRLAAQQNLAIDVLDVDMLFDGLQAVVQFVGDDSGLEGLARKLERIFAIAIRLENLAQPAPADEPDGGCGKPDCGHGAGSCTTCATGGGCSSCARGSGVDLRPYFAHLRDQMEKSQRHPLL